MNSYLKGMFYKFKLLVLSFNLLHISSLVSLFLMVFFSPMLLFVWLVVPTLYFLEKANYKQIINVWVYPFITWYIIFTVSLVFSCGISSIIIGHGHTNEMLQTMLVSNLLFENLCFQTVFILHLLSQKLGCCIYIPVLFSFPKTFNMGKDDKVEPPKDGVFKNLFASKPGKIEKDFKSCPELAKELDKS